MAIDEKLLEAAQTNPAGLWFDDAVKLAGQLGFEEVRREGSHRIFHHSRGNELRSEYPRPLNLQRGKNGKAKAYQVKQMLEMAETLGIITKQEGR